MLKIIDIASAPAFAIPGIEHRTIAGSEHGSGRSEAWIQTVGPGEATPMHKHDCEEVVVILTGQALCRLEDGTEFLLKADQSATMPANVVHQFINTGDQPSTALAFFTMTPVRVEHPDGTPMPLPWQG